MRRLGLAGLLAAFVLGMALPSGALSLTDVPRGVTVGAATDTNAELGMAINASVGNCQRERLVNVTNNLHPSVDVTVTLADGSVGTLYNTANADSGNSVTFALASGASAGVELDADYTGSLPATVAFDVSAAGTSVSVDAARSTTVDGNCPPVADFTISGGGWQDTTVDASPSSDQDGSISTYEWWLNDPTASGSPHATGQTVQSSAPSSGDTITLVVTDDDGATDKITKTVP